MSNYIKTTIDTKYLTSDQWYGLAKVLRQDCRHELIKRDFIPLSTSI